jgi:hypothetical protein
VDSQIGTQKEQLSYTIAPGSTKVSIGVAARTLSAGWLWQMRSVSPVRSVRSQPMGVADDGLGQVLRRYFRVADDSPRTSVSYFIFRLPQGGLRRTLSVVRQLCRNLAWLARWAQWQIRCALGKRSVRCANRRSISEIPPFPLFPTWKRCWSLENTTPGDKRCCA